MEHLFDQWYDEYKEDQGLLIACNLRPDGDIVPKDKAKVWFLKRAKTIQRKLQIHNDSLTVYRCMLVDENWIKSLKNGATPAFGDNWTVDKNLVAFLKGGFGGTASAQNIILEAKITTKDFNVLSLFQPSYSDEYGEFEIWPHRGVLLKVYNGNFSEVLLETEMPFETMNSY